MQGSSNEPAKCDGVSAATNGSRFTLSRNLDEHSPRPGSVSASIKHDYQTSHHNHCTRQTNWRDRKIRPKLSLPRSYDPTYTSKTHLTNRNTETSAARLAALGEPIDYDYDYRSECNEQTRNHRGA